MKTRLRKESVATRIASGRLTPAETIEAITRQKRSTSAYWIVSPRTGTLSRKPCQRYLPRSKRCEITNRSAQATIAARMTHHQPARKSVKPISMRVGRGSSASRSAKKSRNFGST